MSRLLALLVVAFCAGPASAEPPVVDLDNHLVAITTGFSGTEVLLFGTVDQAGDVVVVMRGPSRPIRMFRKSRIAGIWVNTASMTFERAPSFFAVASTRPLEDIADRTVLRRNRMLLEDLPGLKLPRSRASENVRLTWRDALIRNQQRLGLYPTELGSVIFLGNRLFSTRVVLPANVPTGEYSVKVFFVPPDGGEVDAATTPLTVSKIGVEAEIFDFAHQQSAWYGVIAILVALMAGWLAHVAFRKA